MPILASAGLPALNPNAPLLDLALCCEAGPQQTVTQPRWSSMSRRAQGTFTTRRGKQYELDQMQPGEHTVVLDNKDSALDPLNTGSPFNGSVVPFRLWRVRAQWPPTPNLITGTQAAGGSVTVPASASNAPLVTLDGWSLTPTRPHSVQVVVSDPTAGVTGQLVFSWFTPAGAVISTTAGPSVSVGSAGTLITATGTPPANAVSGTVALVVSGPASASTLTHGSWQIEQASTPSGFQTPGTWYPLFTGYVERWPQQWQDHGARGESHPIIVDALSFLSQQTLKPAYINDLLAQTPNFLYALDEPAGSTTFRDTTGINNAGGLFESIRGQGASIAPGAALPQVAPLPGTSIEQLSFTDTFLGTPGPVVNFPNPNNTASGQPFTAVTVPPRYYGSGFPRGPWTRVIAFNCVDDGNYTTGISRALMGCWDPVTNSGYTLNVYANKAYTGASPAPYSVVLVGQTSSSTVAIVSSPPVYFGDGQWHLLFLSLDASGNCLISVDDNITTEYANISLPTYSSRAVEVIGGDPFPNNPPYGAVAPWRGQIGIVAEVPTSVFQVPLLNHLYASWRVGWGARQSIDITPPDTTKTETSGTRYKRLTGWSPFGGVVNTDQGETVLYGPATDLNTSGKSQSTSVVTALQAVVDTENGDHYVDAAGNLVFKARSARYTVVTPSVIFGEQAGEIPYLDVGFDFDPTHIVNDVAITEAFSGAVAYSADTTSRLAFGEKSLQRSVNSLDPLEVQAAADFFVVSEKTPQMRVTKLVVDPSSNPALWPACLALDLGQRARVMRRPPAPAAAITFDGWIEAVAWNCDLTTGRMTVTVEIVPILPYVSAQAAATNLTLNTAVTTGGSLTITLNPLPDAATVDVRANIGDNGSDVWYIDPGTSVQEAFRLSTITGGTPGYSTFQMVASSAFDPVTGTASLAGFKYAHAVNAVVTDAWPSPPHTWDNNAAADSTAAAY